MLSFRCRPAGSFLVEEEEEEEKEKGSMAWKKTTIRRTSDEFVKAYKEGDQWILACPSFERHQDVLQQAKVSWSEVGFYYLPVVYDEQDVYHFDYEYAVPFHLFVGARQPCFQSGQPALMHGDERKDDFDWDTVDWNNPRYPWEGPSLQSKYWPRQDGTWVQNQGWWEIHYPDGTKVVPMWDHKQRCLEKEAAKESNKRKRETVEKPHPLLF